MDYQKLVGRKIVNKGFFELYTHSVATVLEVHPDKGVCVVEFLSELKKGYQLFYDDVLIEDVINNLIYEPEEGELVYAGNSEFECDKELRFLMFSDGFYYCIDNEGFGNNIHPYTYVKPKNIEISNKLLSDIDSLLYRLDTDDLSTKKELIRLRNKISTIIVNTH